MTLSASAARGSAVTLFFQAIKLVVMLASIVVLARLISPDQYGLMAMAMAMIGIAEIFRDFGLSTAALQAKDLTSQQQSNLWWINLAIGATLTLVVFLLAHPIAGFYGQPDLIPVIQVVSVIYLLGSASTQFRVHINRQLRFVALSTADVVPYALGFFAALWMALLGAGVWALVAQQIVAALSGLILSVIFAHWWPGLPRRASMSNLVKFGLSLAATQTISYATRNVDSIALGRVWGASVVGTYDRAYQLMVMPLNQINAPLSKVAIPVLARLQDEKERLVAYIRQAQLVAIYVTAAGFALLAALGPQVVEVLLGPAWGPSGLIVSALAVGGVFRSLVQICYWIYMSQGLATAQLKYFAVAQPLLIAVTLAGLPWGALGVAVAHSLGFGLYWVASLLWVGRVAKIQVGPLFHDAARGVLLFGAPAGALAWLAVALTPALPPVLEILIGVGIALIWFAVARTVFPRIREDIGALIRFAKLALSRK